MTKIIVVRGSNNSGKTSVIRRFLEKSNVGKIPYERKDITVVVQAKKIPATCVIGATSAGDPGADRIKALQQNLAFLRARNCDVIVCAARTKPTYDLIRQFAKSWNNATVIEIQTESASNSADVDKKNKKVANKIYAELW